MQTITAQIPEGGTKSISSHSQAGERTILRVEGLHKTFGGQVVLDRVSLELHCGEVVLLRGDNGSGKTTLLNILTGHLEADAGTIQLFTNGVEEDFHFPRHLWQAVNPFNHFTPERMSWAGIGRTWQEIRLFPTQNLRDNIALATPGQLGENPVWLLLRRFAVRQQEKSILNTCEGTLAELGLKGREASSGDRVSMGQSKRVAIARAVQAGARILFLDEPLAGLDASGITEVMNLLKKLAHNKKVTLVIVEHVFNIPRILNLATTVWTLKGQKVTVETPASVQAEIEHTDGDGIQGWIRKITGTDSDILNQKLPGGAVLSMVIPAGTNLGPVVLEVEDLAVFRGKRLVIGERGQDSHIQGLSFALHRGQIGFLQAPNGWGKTTLLEAIAGLIPITRGSIRLNGKPIKNLPPWERGRLGISFLQARNHTFPSLTVREALSLAQVTHIPEDIVHLLTRKTSHLSGGEKHKVAITCSTKGKAFIVGLFDEPFSALDARSIRQDMQWALVSSACSALVALPLCIERTMIHEIP